ncbi:Regulator of rDNA transcription protein 15 [Capsicum baccatum]|uniref:Regulator of rDNA transcription protein 15 n=1 Tax=Capsicum baccatum TaxID=33114 RepID=A0A2G2UWC9_CAPBA|nr:Regulator of rDNA transcription protein 15 [Capsicum baccatum]
MKARRGSCMGAAHAGRRRSPRIGLGRMCAAPGACPESSIHYSPLARRHRLVRSLAPAAPSWTTPPITDTSPALGGSIGDESTPRLMHGRCPRQPPALAADWARPHWWVNNPTLGEFYITMIGRADIEGSKSNVAMNAWLPQASYPCGTFFDTSTFEFRRSKGSLGHAFTVRIRTGSQNQTSFYPSVPHEISILVELILGYLRYLLTDVTPQPNSPPDNMCRPSQTPHLTMSSARIGPQSEPWVQKEGQCPASDSRNNRIPLVRTSSELAVRRAGKAPEGTVPSPSPGRHAATRSRRGSSSSSPPTADGFGTGTPVPSPQSQSFSRSYGSILPTSLAYIVPSTRGCSPWRPDAVMSTTGRGRHSFLWIFKGRRERTGHHATCGALPAAGPYLRLRRFQGGQAVK